MQWRKMVLGQPLKTRDVESGQVGVWEGLSILAPDALSSVAYGTQEIIIVLMMAGTAALWYSLPISAIIVLLLSFLVIGYRQIIAAYPGGGGAYVIGRDTIGPNAGLMAGAALMVDYTLTVAVSVTAGVAALVSAFPFLLPWSVPLCVVVVLFMTVVNLRGVRESARLFAPPTYIFIVMVLSMVVAGLLKHDPTAQPFHQDSDPIGLAAVAPMLLLRAFSSGSSALTGVEAISNGVPIFLQPGVRRARTALMLLGLFLGSMFLGTSLIAYRFHIHVTATSKVTVLQLLANDIFGHGIFFYVLSFITMSILAVAANTSFAGFPQLASVMARDQWMPRMFMARGDRLVYQNGIVVLGTVAAILVIVFNANTDSLIPLYAVGVYMSFTIALISLAKKRLSEPHAPGRGATVVVGIFGGILTATVVVISIIAKFTHGAYMVVIAIPLIVLGLRAIRRHYQAVTEMIQIQHFEIKPVASRLVVIVPVASVNKMTRESLSYALSMNPDELVVLHVAISPEQAAQIQERWNKWDLDRRIKLVVIQSQYRSVIRPLVRYIDHFRNLLHPGKVVVVIPEMVVDRFWKNLLHNHMAMTLQAVLLFRRQVVVTVVPFKLDPEQIKTD